MWCTRCAAVVELQDALRVVEEAGALQRVPRCVQLLMHVRVLEWAATGLEQRPSKQMLARLRAVVAGYLDQLPAPQQSKKGGRAPAEQQRGAAQPQGNAKALRAAVTDLLHLMDGKNADQRVSRLRAAFSRVWMEVAPQCEALCEFPLGEAWWWCCAGLLKQARACRRGSLA